MKENNICQCCSMPLNNEILGTNNDGSTNVDYCIYCFKNGVFTQDLSLEDYIEYSIQFASEVGMSDEEMRSYCIKTLPNLKRWNNY